ncbi:enhancer of mRNA-decapping protein 3-like [Chanos chanos]|uniref:Enhancer of mRNA-decapping protein 3 n=1 Tax=Chanos chanos TaxID=29144 RepID=A0A6J2WYH2_CHACN|nr:enhancer of mRNA-decapping protein 3 [Chanos chanos]
MAEEWLGSLVSIHCGETLGVYQGEISSIDTSSQTMSLRQPFHNGIRCPIPEVTFSAVDIEDLRILEFGNNNNNNDNNNNNSRKAGHSMSACPSLQPGGLVAQNNRDAATPSTASVTTLCKSQFPSTGPSGNEVLSQAAPKPSGVNDSSVGGRRRTRDEESLGKGRDEGLDAVFDFEGNLALFDKESVVSQIDGSERRGNATRSEVPAKERTVSRYRREENVLETKPAVFRQITAPQCGGKEYFTDYGLLVPTVPYELYKSLLAAAERHGLTLERRLEMMGVCASQMALTLLGGPNRLNPKNVHQRPTVVLLCGPHLQGAQGISCGRHLANHEVDVVCFLPNFVKMQESITNELSLFTKTGSRQVSNVRDLPVSPVDLVINCLDCHENVFLKEQPWYRAAADWANQNRAPVLSIDPPVNEPEQAVEAKWSLCLGLPLPLAETAGRIYLCDVGVPRQVFQEVGISYHSPFGSKFIIALHAA